MPVDRPVETEYQEMLFRVETEHSDKELYQIIAQSRPVQMISYLLRIGNMQQSVLLMAY